MEIKLQLKSCFSDVSPEKTYNNSVSSRVSQQVRNLNNICAHFSNMQTSAVTSLITSVLTFRPINKLTFFLLNSWLWELEAKIEQHIQNKQNRNVLFVIIVVDDFCKLWCLLSANSSFFKYLGSSVCFFTANAPPLSLNHWCWCFSGCSVLHMQTLTSSDREESVTLLMLSRDFLKSDSFD